MSTVTVAAKGQVALRKDMQTHLGLRPGQRIAVEKLPAPTPAVSAPPRSTRWPKPACASSAPGSAVLPAASPVRSPAPPSRRVSFSETFGPTNPLPRSGARRAAPTSSIPCAPPRLSASQRAAVAGRLRAAVDCHAEGPIAAPSSAPSVRCAMRDPEQGLGLAEQREPDIDARHDHVWRLQPRRDAIGAPIIWIVEPAVSPAIRAGGPQAPKNGQPAQPALAQGRIRIFFCR